jgi:hypothetical protein
MGEARRRKEQLRSIMMEELTTMAAAPSEQELQLAAELLLLPAAWAQRESPERLAWANMQPRQCHPNVAAYVRLDPNQRSIHRVGWWKQGAQFVLHSVVEIDGAFVCLTPQQPGVPDRFPFVLDPKITLSDDGGGIIGFRRDGQPFPKVVRANPAPVIQVAKLGLDRLASGMDPHSVWAELDREMSRLMDEQ